MVIVEENMYLAIIYLLCICVGFFLCWSFRGISDTHIYIYLLYIYIYIFRYDSHIGPRLIYITFLCQSRHLMAMESLYTSLVFLIHTMSYALKLLFVLTLNRSWSRSDFLPQMVGVKVIFYP